MIRESCPVQVIFIAVLFLSAGVIPTCQIRRSESRHKGKMPRLRKRVTVTVHQDLTLAPATEWPLSSCIAFRFVFTYMLLFLGSFAAFFVPLSYPLAAVSQVVWGALIPWVADHILLVPPPPLVSDGDGLGQWIQFGGCAALAVVATLIWSVAVRRRKNYATLHAWLRVILRYALGIAMVLSERLDQQRADDRRGRIEVGVGEPVNDARGEVGRRQAEHQGDRQEPEQTLECHRPEEAEEHSTPNCHEREDRSKLDPLDPAQPRFPSDVPQPSRPPVSSRRG